jgi:hypothetical protein
MSNLFAGNFNSHISVLSTMKFVCGQTVLPHLVGACVHMLQRIYCFLPASEDPVSLVFISMLCLF